MNRNFLVEAGKTILTRLELTEGMNLASGPYIGAYKRLRREVEANSDPKSQYEAIVEELANNIVQGLNVEFEDLQQQFHEAIDELDHPWLSNYEACAAILAYSNHPTMEFATHGVQVSPTGKQDFPFRECAAAALEADVTVYLREHFGIDGLLTAETVEAAQEKLANS